jgi:hypothetical protein
MLRLPGDFFHFVTGGPLALSEGGAHRRSVSIRPRRFDDDSTEMRVTRFRNAAAPRPLAARVLELRIGAGRSIVTNASLYLVVGGVWCADASCRRQLDTSYGRIRPHDSVGVAGICGSRGAIACAAQCRRITRHPAPNVKSLAESFKPKPAARVTLCRRPASARMATLTWTGAGGLRIALMLPQCFLLHCDEAGRGDFGVASPSQISAAPDAMTTRRPHRTRAGSSRRTFHWDCRARPRRAARRGLASDTGSACRPAANAVPAAPEARREPHPRQQPA